MHLFKVPWCSFLNVGGIKLWKSVVHVNFFPYLAMFQMPQMISLFPVLNC